MADVDPRLPGGAFDAYSCPDCGFGLVGAEGEPYLIHCERCGKYFEVPEQDRADGSAARDEDEASRANRLSSLRIRQLATGRRAAYRSRSYCVVGALVCVVAAVQLAWNGVALLRVTGVGWRPTAYLLAAGAAGWGALYFFRKATELDREAKQSALAEPTAEPDFAPLSDGSQQWKDLEDIR